MIQDIHMEKNSQISVSLTQIIPIGSRMLVENPYFFVLVNHPGKAGCSNSGNARFRYPPNHFHPNSGDDNTHLGISNVTL